VLKESSGLCEICLSKGLIVPAVHVHHKIHLTPENLNDPKIALDMSNLMALCEACHAEQHKTTKRWRCDPDGHVPL
jgi:5-methylcytosine-specific restriction endonuclease McrA